VRRVAGREIVAAEPAVSASVFATRPATDILKVICLNSAACRGVEVISACEIWLLPSRALKFATSCSNQTDCLPPWRDDTFSFKPMLRRWQHCEKRFPIREVQARDRQIKRGIAMCSRRRPSEAHRTGQLRVQQRAPFCVPQDSSCAAW